MPGDNNPIFRVPARKSCRRDWQDVKDEVFRLYIEEEQSLDITMDSVHESYQFYASRRTWNNKLKKWGFNKYFKAQDMKFMVRKREERADKGKDTTFFHRSTAVPTERIEKYEKKQTGETLPDVSTPSDIEYGTPRPMSQEAPPYGRYENFTSPLSLQSEFSNPSTARAALTQSGSLNIETPLLHGFDLQMQYSSAFTILEHWLVDPPSTVSERLVSGHLYNYDETLDRNQQLFDQTEICLGSGLFAKNNPRLSGPCASSQPNTCYIPDWSSLDPHSAINYGQEDMAIEIAALEDMLSLTQAWETRNYDRAEYHCRRILDRCTQTDVQCFLGMILADTSRLEESAFWLSSALTSFIVQFDLYSLNQNHEIFKPIESLVNKLILRNYQLDTTFLADCMCQMVALIRQADLDNAVHQITPQLFIQGFRFAHACAVSNLLSSANYTYDVLLKHSSSHLDAALHGIEQARAYQRYGLLLRRLGRWASSATQLLSAYKSVMKSRTYDGGLVTILEDDCAELLPHLSLELENERLLADALKEKLTQIQLEYRPSPLEDYVLSADLPSVFITLDPSPAQQVLQFRLPAMLSGSGSRKRTLPSDFSSKSTCSKGHTFPSSGMTDISFSEFVTPRV